MRIALVHYMNAADESVWNGFPAYMIKRLREGGHEVIAVGPLRGRFPLFAHVVSHIRRRIYRYFAKKQFYVHRDPIVARARGRYASKLLAKIPNLDAVLCVTPWDAAYIRTDIPIYLYFDSTWFQCLDFYGDCMRKDLAQATIDGGIEIDRATYTNCTRVIYSSKWAVDSAIKDYGADPNLFDVVGVGAALKETPDQETLKQSLSKRGKRPCRLLFVARDWDRKGGDMALKIARELIASGTPCELHLVGCNAPEPVPEFVVAHGFLNKKAAKDLAVFTDLYQSSDFFVLPTKADCTPIALAEAAAYGMPVVTTNIAGIPEMIPDKSWGVTLPVNASPKEYADWINSLYYDRARYNAACLAAWKHYHANLRDTQLSEKLTGIFESALVSHDEISGPAQLSV